MFDSEYRKSVKRQKKVRCLKNKIHRTKYVLFCTRVSNTLILQMKQGRSADGLAFFYGWESNHEKRSKKRAENHGESESFTEEPARKQHRSFLFISQSAIIVVNSLKKQAAGELQKEG